MAGRLLGINPFDQPDVEAAKVAARGLLEERPEACFPTSPTAPSRYAAAGWLGELARRRAVRDLLGKLGPDGYVSVQAYLDRFGDGPNWNGSARVGRSHRPSRDLRLGAALPALHRPVPQGRTGHRRLPATDRRSSRGRPDPGPAVQFGELIAAQAAGDAAGARPSTGAPSCGSTCWTSATGVATSCRSIVSALAGQAASSTES